MGKDNSLKDSTKKDFEEIKNKIDALLNQRDYRAAATYLNNEIARIGNPAIKEMLEKILIDVDARVNMERMADQHNLQQSPLPVAPPKESVTSENPIAQYLPKITEIVEEQKKAVAQLLPILAKDEVQLFSNDGSEIAVADRKIIPNQQRKFNVVNAQNHNDANIIESAIGAIYDKFCDLGFVAQVPEENKIEPVVEEVKVAEEEIKKEPKFFAVLMPKEFRDHDLLTMTQDRIQDAMRVMIDLKNKPFRHDDYCVLHDVVGNGHSKDELFSFRDLKLQEFMENIENKLQSATSSVVKGAHIASKFISNAVEELTH